MKVQLKQVEKYYKNKQVLDVDRLEFEDGKIYALLGPNGAGKTTLLRIIAGIEKVTSGSLLYDGVKNILGNVAYMPQSTYMFDMSVLENVKLGFTKDSADDDKLALNALSCVGMESFANAKARLLSGGEAQRVAVARTLVLGRSLILLDEPASSTDMQGIELVENYIKEVNRKERSTIVFTSHNLSQAARIADEAIMIFNGRILEKGDPKLLFNSPQNRETIQFLNSWRL